VRLVEVGDGLLGDLVLRDHLRPAGGSLLLGGRLLSAMLDVCEPSVEGPGQAHEEVGKAERLGNARAHELLVGETAAPLEDLRDHPHARGRVVPVAPAGLELELPLRETLEPLLAARPLPGGVGCVREACGVEEELLHRHGVLPVRAELRDDVDHPLVDGELAVLDQQPARGGDDRLGAGEDDIERLVGRRCRPSLVRHLAIAVHGCELAVTGDGELAGGKPSLVDLFPGPREERIEATGIEAKALRRRSEVSCVGHAARLPRDAGVARIPRRCLQGARADSRFSSGFGEELAAGGWS
jgi:hypothetical protein